MLCVKIVAFAAVSTVYVDAYVLLIRRKRQELDEDGLPKSDYNIPPTNGAWNPFKSGNTPFPGRSSSNLYPEFPFSHQFNNGLDVNPGTIYSFSGNLNVPLKKWGAVWDLKGKFDTGPSHVWYNYGHLIQPVNPLNLPPSTIAALASSPEFQAERANAPLVPVAQLPTGWQPVHCKPPLCNPFVQTVDTGFQVEPGNDRWFDGSLDFPIPGKAPGQGVRFPLSGNMYAGTQPIYVNYGHHINPVDPFKHYKPNQPQQAAAQFLQSQRRGSSSNVQSAIGSSAAEVQGQEVGGQVPTESPLPIPPPTPVSIAAVSPSDGQPAFGTLPLVKPPPISALH